MATPTARKKRAHEMDQIVRDGMDTTLATGHALLVIRDEKLFIELGYKNFREYCEGVHQITDRRARQLISGSVAASDVEDGDKLPERVQRVLASAPKSKRKKIMKVALEKADGKITKVTSTIAQEAADEVLEPEGDAVAVDGLGEELPEAFVAIFSESCDLVDLRNDVLALRKLLMDMAEDEIGTYLASNVVTAALDDAARAIRMAMPYTICNECSGDGCDNCHNTGWWAKPQWDAYCERRVDTDDHRRQKEEEAELQEF